MARCVIGFVMIHYLNFQTWIFLSLLKVFPLVNLLGLFQQLRGRSVDQKRGKYCSHISSSIIAPKMCMPCPWTFKVSRYLLTIPTNNESLLQIHFSLSPLVQIHGGSTRTDLNDSIFASPIGPRTTGKSVIMFSWAFAVVRGTESATLFY